MPSLYHVTEEHDEIISYAGQVFAESLPVRRFADEDLSARWEVLREGGWLNPLDSELSDGQELRTVLDLAHIAGQQLGAGPYIVQSLILPFLETEWSGEDLPVANYVLKGAGSSVREQLHALRFTDENPRAVYELHADRKLYILHRSSGGQAVDAESWDRQEVGSLPLDGPSIHLITLATLIGNLGIARAVITLAAEYTNVREQFGRPISQFQAVRHHIGEAYTAYSIARSSVFAATDATIQGSTDEEIVKEANFLVNIAIKTAVERMTQVFGGVGVTWEHDMHLYLKAGRSQCDITYITNPVSRPNHPLLTEVLS